MASADRAAGAFTSRSVPTSRDGGDCRRAASTLALLRDTRRGNALMAVDVSSPYLGSNGERSSTVSPTSSIPLPLALRPCFRQLFPVVPGAPPDALWRRRSSCHSAT